jgi:hypothetical protein
MKLTTLLNYLGWASGIFGGLLILSGTIGFLTGAPFLGVKYFINYFFISPPFLLFGIFLLVGTRTFCHCDENCCKDEEKK